MKNYWFLWILVFFSACIKEQVEIEQNCTLDMSGYDTSFGIDYNDDIYYLNSGEQSDLSTENSAFVIGQIGEIEQNIEGVKMVWNWLRSNFEFENAGGSMIGAIQVDDLFHEMKVYGCHSESLLLASVIRTFGFPAVVVETADIDWAYDFNNGTADYYQGHVMVEIFVDGQWILWDYNGRYITEYDPYKPLIPDPNSNGLYTYAKGFDSWDYGVAEHKNTIDLMEYFAEHIICYEPWFVAGAGVWIYL